MISGIAAATTTLVLLSVVTKTLVNPVESLSAALTFTKSIFTTVLTGLHVIPAGDLEVASPTFVILSIVSTGVAALGVALGYRVYDEIVSHYQAISIPVYREKTFELIKDKYEFPELINNLENLKYLLAGILFIQILSMIRNEINIYNDNNPSYSSKILIEDK